MLSIAFPLWYPLKTIQFILDSSLMAFASLFSYVMQLLHFMVLTHHLLHPSFALLLCFRRLPSEPQVRACNPELLQATVLPSRHGLARVWIIPSANHRSHLLHGPYLLLLPLFTLWSVACTSFLASFSSIILSISLFLAPDVLAPDSPPYIVSPISSSRDNRNWHAQYLCTVAGRLGLLAVPLSRAIQFADDSSPLTISDGGVSLQRTRKSKSVGGVKGKAAIQTQTKKTTKAVKVWLVIVCFHIVWRSAGCVKNDRRRKRMTSMLRILHLELESASTMTSIHPVWLRVVICCFWISIRVDCVPWNWMCAICEWKKDSLSL